MRISTLSAIQASVAHWERMQANWPESAESPDVDECALCQLFYNSTHWDHCCYSCPIFNVTGQRFCIGTPYHAAARAFDGADAAAWQAAAQAEIDFLKSLLPGAAP